MDLFYILQILWKKKWLLIAVAISTTALTYFLVKLLPPEFKSEAVISTGVVERWAIELERDNPFVQQFQVNSQFSNFTTRLQSRTSIRRLTYDLLRHDLSALLSGEMPFQELDEEEWKFEEQEAKEILSILEDENIHIHPSKEEEPRLRKVAKAFGYTFKNLSESFNIYREGNTDYLKVIGKADNAELSAFLVNTLSENFSKSYNNEKVLQENISVSFYMDLAKEKKRQVDSLGSIIAQYKRTHRIVDLAETGSSLIAERKDLEMAREEERKNIEGLRKAVGGLNDILQTEGFDISQEETDNLLLREEVSQLKEQKGDLLQQYNLQGRSNDDLQKEIRQKDQELDAQIEELVKERIEREDQAERNKELRDVYIRKIEAEIDLLIAEESVKSLNQALGVIEQRAVSFVTDETVLERLEGEKTIRTEEYLNIVTKMNEARRIALAAATPLSIIEYGEIPEKPESSKGKIIAVLGGIVATGAVALLLIFLNLFRDYWGKG
ncbi:MAG: Wzz/FepE/Etk N-terminal domain-containing protein, partial [Bacteroidota bacterium]